MQFGPGIHLDGPYHFRQRGIKKMNQAAISIDHATSDNNGKIPRSCVVCHGVRTPDAQAIQSNSERRQFFLDGGWKETLTGFICPRCQDPFSIFTPAGIPAGPDTQKIVERITTLKTTCDELEATIGSMREKLHADLLDLSDAETEKSERAIEKNVHTLQLHYERAAQLQQKLMGSIVNDGRELLKAKKEEQAKAGKTMSESQSELEIMQKKVCDLDFLVASSQRLFLQSADDIRGLEAMINKFDNKAR